MTVSSLLHCASGTNYGLKGGLVGLSKKKLKSEGIMLTYL